MAGFDSRCRDGAKFRARKRMKSNESNREKSSILSLDFGRCHFFSFVFRKTKQENEKESKSFPPAVLVSAL